MADHLAEDEAFDLESPADSRPEESVPPSVDAVETVAEEALPPPIPELSFEEKLRIAVQLTGEHANPNTNALAEIVRNIPGIAFSIKALGFDLASRLAPALPKVAGAIRHVGLESKASTQADLETDWMKHWCSELGIPVVYHRKIWEFGYVMQALHENGVMREGASAVGFGCGTEALPSYFAAKGIKVLVTDLAPDDQRSTGWANTAQHTTGPDSVYRAHLVDRAVFDRHVSLRYVDMNDIPEDIQGHDFCWSICALEHLGSIRKGLDFLRNSLNVLKPGGISVHTTEYNFAHDEETIDHWGTVLFLRRHFREIYSALSAEGHYVAPLNLDVGSKVLDRFIDVPPYADKFSPVLWREWSAGIPHIKMLVDGFPSTCFGFIIRKAA